MFPPIFNTPLARAFTFQIWENSEHELLDDVCQFQALSTHFQRLLCYFPDMLPAAICYRSLKTALVTRGPRPPCGIKPLLFEAHSLTPHCCSQCHCQLRQPGGDPPGGDAEGASKSPRRILWCPPRRILRVRCSPHYRISPRCILGCSTVSLPPRDS
jgi:hypothetical protein